MPPTERATAGRGAEAEGRLARPRIRFWYAAAIALPAATAAWFVSAVEPVPLLDSWAHLAWYVSIVEGTATVSDFLAPDRMHWVWVPRGYRTLLAFATDWSLAAEIWTCLALALATLWGIARIARTGEPSQRGAAHRRVANVLCAALLFSPNLLFAWTWPPGIVHFLMNAFLVIAASELQRVSGEADHARLARAAGLCALATFTRAEGFLSWFLLLPVVIDRIGVRARARRVLLLWTSAGALGAVAVARAALSDSGQAKPMDLPASASLMLNVIGLPFGRFVLAMRSGYGETGLYVPFGIALVVLQAALAAHFGWRAAPGERSRALPWISLGVFGGAVALGVGLSRHFMIRTLSGHVIFLPMYALGAILASVAAVQLTALYLSQRDHSRRWRVARLASASLAIACCVGSYATFGRDAIDTRHQLHGADICLRLASHWASPNACFGPGPRPEQLDLLRRSGFREIAESVRRVSHERAQYGGIDGHRLDADGGLRLWGHALLPGEGGTPEHVLFSVDDGDFIGFARVTGREGGAGTWYVRLPAQLRPSAGERLRAWAYDPARQQAVALQKTWPIGKWAASAPPP